MYVALCSPHSRYSCRLVQQLNSFSLQQMTKAKRLKYTNWCLLIGMALTLCTSIALEATHSRHSRLVVAHMGLALYSVILCVVHIYLHFGRCNWFLRFSKLKKQATRILWWCFLSVIVSAIIATVHWSTTGVHAPIGGIHGKTCFLMLAVAFAHVFKRRRCM
jgi:hypothetical protein